MKTKPARATLKPATNAETFIARAVAVVKAGIIAEAQARDALKSADAVRFAALASIVHEAGVAFTAPELQRIWTDAGGKLADASAGTYASQLGMAARLSKAGKELPESLKAAKSKAAAVEALTKAVKDAGLKSAKGRKTADDTTPKATSPKDASPETRKASRAMLADAAATMAALAQKMAADPIACGALAAKAAELETAIRQMIGGIDDATAIDGKGKSE